MSTQLFGVTGSPPLTTFPAGYGASWNQTDSTQGGSSCKTLSTTSQSSQQAATKSNWSAILHGTNSNLGCIQFASSKLAAQTISSGTWTMGFAMALTNASSNFIWKGVSFIGLVNGTTGNLRSTIFALAVLGSTGRSSTSELTVFSSALSGSSATVTAGDFLIWEFGLNASDTSISGSDTPSTDAYYNGSTAISSDDASTSSAQSFITCPQTLTFLGAGGILGPNQLDGLGGTYFGNRIAKYDWSQLPHNEPRRKGRRRVYVDLGVST